MKAYDDRPWECGTQCGGGGGGVVRDGAGWRGRAAKQSARCLRDDSTPPPASSAVLDVCPRFQGPRLYGTLAASRAASPPRGRPPPGPDRVRHSGDISLSLFVSLSLSRVWPCSEGWSCPGNKLYNPGAAVGGVRIIITNRTDNYRASGAAQVAGAVFSRCIIYPNRSTPVTSRLCPGLTNLKQFITRYPHPGPIFIKRITETVAPPEKGCTWLMDSTSGKTSTTRCTDAFYGFTSVHSIPPTYFSTGILKIAIYTHRARFYRAGAQGCQIFDKRIPKTFMSNFEVNSATPSNTKIYQIYHIYQSNNEKYLTG